MKANGFELQKGVKQMNVHTFKIDHEASRLPLDREKRKVVNIFFKHITHFQDIHNIAGPLVHHACPKRGLIHRDSHATNEASALPPSHHDWINVINILITSV